MYKGWPILTLTFTLAEGENPITGHQVVKLKDNVTRADAFEIEICTDASELPLGIAQVDEGSEIKPGEAVPVMVRGISFARAAVALNPRDEVSPGGNGLVTTATNVSGQYRLGWVMTKTDGLWDEVLVCIDPSQVT